MDYKCVPGMVLIQPTSRESIIASELKNTSRCIMGIVKAIGEDYLTDYGTIIKSAEYAKVGDTVIFWINDPEYDYLTIDNAKYYCVFLKDLRVVHA